jgi:hypothetical protein
MVNDVAILIPHAPITQSFAAFLLAMGSLSLLANMNRLAAQPSFSTDWFQSRANGAATETNRELERSHFGKGEHCWAIHS